MTVFDDIWRYNCSIWIIDEIDKYFNLVVGQTIKLNSTIKFSNHMVAIRTGGQWQINSVILCIMP